MFTPDPADFRLRDVMRRAAEPLGPTATYAEQLLQARADIRQLLILIDDLDEQLTDALNGSFDDE